MWPYSVCHSPHPRQWKIYISGSPPNRCVLRTNFIGWAQPRQRGGLGGFGSDLSAHSSHMTRCSLMPRKWGRRWYWAGALTAGGWRLNFWQCVPSERGMHRHLSGVCPGPAGRGARRPCARADGRSWGSPQRRTHASRRRKPNMGPGHPLAPPSFHGGRRSPARLKLLNAIAALDCRRLSFYFVATRWLAFGPPRAWNDVHAPCRHWRGFRSPWVEPKLWCHAAFKAFSIHPIKWSSRSGLFRKQTAPAFMARARTLSSG